jgi:DNA-directed RNA polymerase specialized sigma24 family protein
MQAECRSWRVRQRSFSLQPLSSKSAMDESIDQQLMALALEAQGHPLQSPARQQALTQLVIAIGQSNQLARLGTYAQYYSAPAFEDFYNEALQETYFYICNKIDLYRPDHPVMAWVNNTLKHKFQEVTKGHPHIKTDPYDPIILDQRLPAPVVSNDPDYECLRLFLETDPEGQLAAYSVRNHPEVTFQMLAIARHLQGTSWQDLSEQTDISLKTLSCFFNRTLQKLLPYCRKYL